MAIGLGLLGVAGIIALSAIIYILTSKGTLEIETDDPNVQVAVKRNGEVVEVVDAKSGWKISLKSGEYELSPQGSTDQFQLDKDSVVVKRGDTAKVKVTLKHRNLARFQRGRWADSVSASCHRQSYRSRWQMETPARRSASRHRAVR